MTVQTGLPQEIPASPALIDSSSESWQEQHRILERFGLEELPPRSVMQLTREQIIIPDEALISTKDINDMGGHILEPPGFALAPGSPLDWNDPAAKFQIIWGRKRTLGAWKAGLNVIECIVYHAHLTPELYDCLASIENMRRKNSWRQEVVYIRRLILAKEPLSESDLVKRLRLGRALVQSRVAIAHLPEALFLLVTTSRRISQQLAVKMTQLSPSSQTKLAELVAQGEQLTKKMIDESWLQQLNTQLTSSTLLSVLHEQRDEEDEQRGDDEATEEVSLSPDGLPPAEQVTSFLLGIERLAVPNRLRVLSQALRQEYTRWLQQQQAANQEEMEVL
jgi:hypothetical protein